MDRLSGCVTRAIRQGHVRMGFVPHEDGSVSLPMTDHAMYLQAVMYWCTRLNASIPRVIEACGRSGDGASVARVKNVLRQIALDDRMVRTTTFFAAEMQR